MENTLKNPFLGAHTSISGGFTKAIKEGTLLECSAIQIFTHSNRQWTVKPLDQNQIDQFIQAQKNSAIRSVIAHAGYLLNIASADTKIRHQSLATLTHELERCRDLNINYLVLHPGARLTQSTQEGIQRIGQALNEVLERVPGNTTILLENMAGQGSVLGSNFEELASMHQQVEQKSRIGFCIDTCHAFAAGYPINTKNGYEKFLKDFDEILGLEHLHAMHLNDSQKECGSRVDRHANIGQGKIGLELFSLIMNDLRLRNVTKIIETPCKENYLEDYAKNLAILRSLIL
jgi:deoxyribonuclease-4